MKRYLRANRLADVITLIQILALDDWAHRCDRSIDKSLGATPQSAQSWKDIAQAHPEFFRFVEAADHSISLIARHLQSPKDGNYGKLSREETMSLIETAIKLYSGELENSRWWTYWVPAITAIVSLIVGTFIGKLG